MDNKHIEKKSFDLDKISKLAMISIDELDKDILNSQLQSILDMVSQIEEVDTSNVSPLYSVLGEESRLREDILKDSLEKDAILKLAPEHDNDYIIVPRIIKK